MKESNKNEINQKLISIAKKLKAHCKKVGAVVNGLEAAQINDASFNLGQTFYTTSSQSMTEAINDLLETYESLRLEVREVARISYVSFENSFPELNINFETYYSVAASLLNLNSQMQLLRLYCHRILKP